ncbi:MAG: hydroxyethylthiazole kinase [Hydrogenoanaerobacterium sp.]
MEQLSEIILNIREKSPVIHFITNYVSVNDCANITAAAGGLPIMADEIHEAEDIVKRCSALAINMGTLNERTVKTMLLAGKMANKYHIPIMLDPVGVGASTFRNKTIATLLREVNFSVIKGNMTEMKFLGGQITDICGVDANPDDMVTEENLDEAVKFALRLSTMAGAIIVITGKIDVIAGRHKAYIIRNSNELMSKVSGTGCMLGAVIASCIAVSPKNIISAAAAATLAMAVCGELAYEKTMELGMGTGTFRTLLIDYMSKLDTETLMTRGKITHIGDNQ